MNEIGPLIWFSDATETVRRVVDSEALRARCLDSEQDRQAVAKLICREIALKTVRVVQTPTGLDVQEVDRASEELRRVREKAEDEAYAKAKKKADALMWARAMAEAVARTEWYAEE